ncbi:unnamed protein product [Prorocentrum cordatum]|uniref:Holocytochrome c-type synthase n=1 Tax=Prorocentrum cordatum TaxID=2364126 RepID=A0ABN9V5E1_9DINO|nr:unnamed protein product [Polarella glacialis]
MPPRRSSRARCCPAPAPATSGPATCHALALGLPVPNECFASAGGGRGAAAISAAAMPAQLVQETEINDFAGPRAWLGIPPTRREGKGAAAPLAVEPNIPDPEDARALWVDADSQNVRHQPRPSAIYESCPTNDPDSPVSGRSSAV